MILDPWYILEASIRKREEEDCPTCNTQQPKPPKYLSSCQSNSRAALAWEWQHRCYVEQNQEAL